MMSTDAPSTATDPAGPVPPKDLPAFPDVRPAGPESIEDIPDDRAEDWDEVDQNIDESFPASDPPGQGVG